MGSFEPWVRARFAVIPQIFLWRGSGLEYDAANPLHSMVANVFENIRKKRAETVDRKSKSISLRWAKWFRYDPERKDW